MSLLVFGKTGQVAREIARRAPHATFLGRSAADLTDPDACARIIAGSRAKMIINAAAYTAVDAAETDEDTAQIVNAAAPTAMACAAADIGAAFVQLSTDYVFDGRGHAPFAPDAPVAPLGAYGRSKAAGEAGVRAAGGAAVILRTSWVFSLHGTNFVRTMLRLSSVRKTVPVVADQFGGPTPAGDIADAVLKIASQLAKRPKLAGTYHFSGAPDASWAEFAREIFTQAGNDTFVQEITTAEWPTPARRPANSRLDCHSTFDTFGIARPDWRAGLAQVLTQMGPRTR